MIGPKNDRIADGGHEFLAQCGKGWGRGDAFGLDVAASQGAEARSTRSVLITQEERLKTGSFALDPSHHLYEGAQYSRDGGLAGVFSDTAPDRWGRTLMERREALHAREEGRRPRSLGDWDFLLGVTDSVRMGALRYCASDGRLPTTPPLRSRRPRGCGNWNRPPATSSVRTGARTRRSHDVWRSFSPPAAPLVALARRRVSTLRKGRSGWRSFRLGTTDATWPLGSTCSTSLRAAPGLLSPRPDFCACPRTTGRSLPAASIATVLHVGYSHRR